jgi:hypothetical protein
MKPDELESLWSRVAAPDPSLGGLAGRPAPTVVKGRGIMLAADAAGQRHLLVPAALGDTAPRQPPVKGLEVAVDELRVGGKDTRRYFDVACREASMNTNFTAVASEILDALDAGEDPKPAIEGVLARWRWFWGAPSAGMSEEEVIGLFGELWFLEHWLSPLNRRVIEAWSGPTGDRHDFRWKAASIEIKATRARSDGSASHRITSLDQLENPVQGMLYLFSLRAIPDAVGQHSLIRSIDRLRAKLGSQPDALVAFDERIARAGYSPAHRDRYETLLRVQAEELYTVVDDFPRLTSASFPEGVPAGVDAVAYTLDLAACAKWKLATAPNTASRGLRETLDED